MLSRDYAESLKAPSSTACIIKDPVETKESVLDKRVQKLVSSIFDSDMMSSQLSHMNYDANKLPLGKLTKKHVSGAYDVLKSVASILQEPRTERTRSQLLELSNEFYSLIPHAFGSRAPPVIASSEVLKSKLHMIEQLGDIEIAQAIKEELAAQGNSCHFEF